MDLSPVVALLSKTVSEDTVVSESTLGPGVLAELLVTAEDSALSRDVHTALLGRVPSEALEWVPALLGFAAERVELMLLGVGPALEWVGPALGVAAEPALSTLVSSLTEVSEGTVVLVVSMASEVAYAVLLLTELLAGGPASLTSSEGSALALVVRGGDLLAGVSHAVTSILIPVRVVSTILVVGVRAEWVPASGEAVGLLVVLARVTAIPAYMSVVSITLVATVDVGVSAEASEHVVAVSVLLLAIHASVRWALLLLTIKLRKCHHSEKKEFHV